MAINDSHCHLVLHLWFNSLTLSMRIPVLTMAPCYTPHFTSTPCGDEGWVSLVLDVEPRMVRAGG